MATLKSILSKDTSYFKADQGVIRRLTNSAEKAKQTS